MSVAFAPTYYEPWDGHVIQAFFIGRHHDRAEYDVEVWDRNEQIIEYLPALTTDEITKLAAERGWKS